MVASLKFSRIRSKRHGYQSVLLLVLAVVVAGWTLWQLSPSVDVSNDDPQRIMPKGNRVVEALTSMKSAHTQKQPAQLLLASHNRLFWFFPETEEQQDVHTGHGVYYGNFPGDESISGGLTSLWVVSRPHNWRPAATDESLLHLSLPDGVELERAKLSTQFTHDAIRAGRRVFACNTGEGSIVEMSFPSMAVVRTMQLFTAKEHINTLAMFDEKHLWVVLHNLGKSLLAQVNLREGRVVRRIANVGVNSHGLVAWRGLFVMLSSKETRLVTVNPETEEVSTVWQGEKGFLKGLVVIDDVAYFGKSPPMERQGRDGLTVNCDIVAVNLLARLELYTRKVETQGLLNVVSAPQMSVRSTYIAQYSNSRAVRAPHTLSEEQTGWHQEERPDVARALDARVAGERAAGGTALVPWSPDWLKSEIDAADVAGEWSTGMPYLDLEGKGHASRQAPVYVHLGKMPPSVLEPLQTKLAAMPQEWWDPDEQLKVSAAIGGREQNLASTKPGVNTMFLIFSTRDYDRIWELPLYRHFKEELDRVLEAVIGADAMRNIVRLQMAQMTEGAHIKPHRDSGPWAKDTHRIHVVVKTHPGISFYSCPLCPSSRALQDRNCQKPPQGTCVALDTTANSIFEVDNLVIHEVVNEHADSRVHLVVDVSERPAPPRKALKAGQVCAYASNMRQAKMSDGC